MTKPFGSVVWQLGSRHTRKRTDFRPRVRILAEHLEDRLVLTSFSYADFTSTAGLTLNGSAAQAGSVLRLTTAANLPNGEAGTAFYNTSVSTGSDFQTHFTFDLHNGGGLGGYADGFTFMIQSGGLNAIGTGGAGMGYGFIGSSVAVEFDIFNNQFLGGLGDTNNNHIALDVNGILTNSVGGPSVQPPFNLYGNTLNAWIDYHSATQTLDVYVSHGAVKPTSPLASFSVDIGSYVGSNGYVGFSGGTAAGWADQDILNWQFNGLPIVAANNGTVTATEGSTATNSGTFSDPGGNSNTTLSASFGTLSQNNSTGTWSWSYTPSEESAPQTVTITASNSYGSTSTSFVLNVNDAPLTPGSIGATGGIEGVTATLLSAGFSDANLAALPSDFSGTINWGDNTTTSFTSADVSGGNGSFLVNGSHQYAEAGTYNVTTTINDAGGSSTTVSGSTSVADAALTAGLLSAGGGMEGVTATALSASFSDANLGALPGDFSGTINWGDNTTTNFTSADVTGGNGNFMVNGSHLYGEAGAYNITVVINDEDQSTTTISGSTAVADAPLTAGTVGASGGVEYVTATSLSATFGDANLGGLLSDFSGTIDWGDNTTTSFTSANVTGGNGSYTVNGSHQYAEAGSYNITVVVNDKGGSSTTVSGSTSVADAPLTPGTVSASGGVEGMTATSLTATFSDANLGALLGDFSGTINWGDNTTTSITSADVSGSNGSFTVNGSHQYAEEGTYNITVTVNDADSSSTTINGVTSVADAPLIAVGQNISGVGGLPTKTQTVATFTDLGGPEATTDYSAVINWGGAGAGSNVGQIVSNGNGTYSVQGSFTYASKGTYTVSVAISHEGQAAATTSSTAIIKDNLGILLLDPTGKGALTDTGNGSVGVTGGGAIIVNSSNAQAAIANGNAVVSAAYIDARGTATSGNGRFVGAVDTTQAPVADPLAGLAAPPVPAIVRSTGTLNITSSVTLQPGLYIGGIHISGQAHVVLAPGVYYIRGGGFSVSGQATVTDNGQGVLIYSAPSKSSDGFSVTGGGQVSLTGLTNSQLASLGLSAPQYAGLQGLAIFQASGAAATFSVSGTATVNITGSVYTADATIAISGTGRLGLAGSSSKGFGSSLIASDLSVSGGGSVSVDSSVNNL